MLVSEVDGNIVLDCEDGEAFGPKEALLGTLAGGAGVLLGWDDPITENPAVGSTEMWEMHNFTEDAHPIHIHEILFEVVNREVIETGAVRAPEPWEMGSRKDTVIAYPGEITRVKATFDRPGLFVWHCHIVEHEDHEMMRPYRIGPDGCVTLPPCVGGGASPGAVHSVAPGWHSQARQPGCKRLQVKMIWPPAAFS